MFKSRVPMSIPQILYKYRAFNQFTVMSLINSSVWFSKPTSFNDPFDCQIKFCETKPSKDVYLRMIEQARLKLEKIGKSVSLSIPESAFVGEELSVDYIKKISEFREQIEIIMFDSCVLSLSYDNTNTTMWSHYADCHQGICIAYNMDKLFGTTDMTKIIHKVNYVEADNITANQYAKYAECCCGNDNEEFNSIVREMLTTKSKDWEYENEWRVICEQRGNLNAGRDAVHAIYFGLKASVDVKITIRNIFEKNPIRYYQMVRSKEGLTIEAVEMPIDSRYWQECPK
ncbi:putative DUF2971 domain-containing protein [Vibrio crassostreae]|nr:putative DUF2971 domain-containing protein [Vibrio crassostreae]CAK2103889.1 putative DUF2971 domain-containing protein [Vibrio crassostreae]